jgi:hypothetical protein
LVFEIRETYKLLNVSRQCRLAGVGQLLLKATEERAPADYAKPPATCDLRQSATDDARAIMDRKARNYPPTNEFGSDGLKAQTRRHHQQAPAVTETSEVANRL